MSEDALSVTNTIGYRDPEWVADQLGIDKQTVYKYLQDGTLPGLQLGRKWLIAEKALVAQLDEMLREQTTARRVGAGTDDGFVSKVQDDASMLGVWSENEARRLNHNYIGQEHILLAIAGSPQCVAARALSTMGIDGKRLRASVELVVGPGPAGAASDVRWGFSLTPRAQRAMDLAAARAAEAGAPMSSKDVLAGIMGEGIGVGAGVLRALGVEPDTFAAAVARVTAPPPPAES